MERIELTELQDSDKTTLFEWINNKELVEFNSTFKPVKWEDHCRWFDSIRARPEVKIFAIRLKNSSDLIGTCQLLNINRLIMSAELQIRVGYFSEMGKGLGSEAVRKLLRYGFKEMKLQRIYLHVFADNIRAIKSYLKNGFIEEGNLRRAAFVKEKLTDVKVMSILEEEFGG